MKSEKIQRGKAAPPSDEFEEWWTKWISLNEDLVALLYSKQLDQIRATAKDAWDAGRKVQAAKVTTETAWSRRSAEMKEASVLAQRHNLVIASTQERGYVVEARRSGKKPIWVQAASWREIIDTLKSMAQRGVL